MYNIPSMSVSPDQGEIKPTPPYGPRNFLWLSGELQPQADCPTIGLLIFRQTTVLQLTLEVRQSSNCGNSARAKIGREQLTRVIGIHRRIKCIDKRKRNTYTWGWRKLVIISMKYKCKCCNKMRHRVVDISSSLAEFIRLGDSICTSLWVCVRRSKTLQLSDHPKQPPPRIHRFFSEIFYG